jgi:L-iditol 2-dehydrogenase
MYYSNSDIRLEQKPVPDIGPDEILVKVLSSGICGSDVLEWYRVPKAPLVLGHEIAGDIEAVGEQVKEWKKGDRVFVSHHVPCNMCRYCISGHHSVCDTLSSTNFDPGGFTEYLRVPAINVRNGLYKLPDSMSYDEGVFVEPLACVFRGQEQAGWAPGRRVLVIGSGVTGLMHIQLARLTGASRIIAVDINDHRLKAAKDFGADVCLKASEDLPLEIKENNDGRLADLALVCAGASSAIEQSFSLVDRGGVILFFAPTDPGLEIAMPFNGLWRQEITMTSSYAGSPRDITQAMELLAAKRINALDMISHKLPLSRTSEGFRMVAEADNSLKVIIEPQE